MRIHRGIRALAATIACALTAAVATAQPAGRHETITGTIFRSDSRAGTLDLLTGVGHSLRIRRVRYATGLRVMAGRAEAGIAALVPGAICRVECEVAESGATATGIEVLHASTGRTR